MFRISFVELSRGLVYPVLSVAAGALLGPFCSEVLIDLLPNPLSLRGNTALQAFLFFALPAVAFYLTARGLCGRVGVKKRYHFGACLVVGSMLYDGLLFWYGWDSYLRFHVWGGCGYGAHRWLCDVMVLPAMLGKTMALRHYFAQVGKKKAPGALSSDQDALGAEL